MIREYFVRGERRTVEEIDDVVAVKVAADERGDANAPVEDFGTEARRSRRRAQRRPGREARLPTPDRRTTGG